MNRAIRFPLMSHRIPACELACTAERGWSFRVIAVYADR